MTISGENGNTSYKKRFCLLEFDKNADAIGKVAGILGESELRLYIITIGMGTENSTKSSSYRWQPTSHSDGTSMCAQCTHVLEYGWIFVRDTTILQDSRSEAETSLQPAVTKEIIKKTINGYGTDRDVLLSQSANDKKIIKGCLLQAKRAIAHVL